MISSKATRSVSSSEMAHNASRVPPKTTKSSTDLTHTKVSIDKSSKTLERKPPNKVTVVTPEKQAVKGSKLQQQLGQAQEDLRKVQDQLADVEDVRSRAINELREMKKLADDASARFSEALLAEKRAQEKSEIEKFRIDELEQASIESAQKTDDEWQLELESMKKQHDFDLEDLLSATEELERLNHELSETSQARDAALEQANDARKRAETNANSVEESIAEIDSLNESLELVNASCEASAKELNDSKWESETREATELASQTSSVIKSLKLELEKAKDAEVKLAEREAEALLEKLKLELSDARNSESRAANSLFESKAKAETLEEEIKRAKEAEGKMLESLICQTKQLEETKMAFEEAKLEIASLRENIESLEVSVDQSSKDIGVAHLCLEKAKLDAYAMKETVEILKSELRIAKEDLIGAQEREESAVLRARGLVEEVNMLKNEFKLATEAEEKSRKAMDDLALALHEVTTDAKQVKEKLALSESELDNARLEADNSKDVLKSMKAKFQLILDEARNEIELVKEASERAKLEVDESYASWNAKEIEFVKCIKASENDIALAKEEINKLKESLREDKEEISAAKEEAFVFRNSLEAAEAKAAIANQTFKMARTENFHLEDSLTNKENELRRISQEKEHLRISEAAALETVHELNCLLLDAYPTKKKSVQDITKKDSDSEKAKLVLDRVNERIGEAWELGSVRKPSATQKELKDHNMEPTEFPSVQPKKTRGTHSLDLDLKSQRKPNRNKETGSDSDNMNGSIFDMLASPDLVESIDSTSDQKTTSLAQLDDEETLNSDDFDHIDGLQFEDMENDRTSPTRQRKKKALLRRFGDLLKKKGNHK